MIDLHFELKYCAREKIWLIYDQTDHYLEAKTVEEIPNALQIMLRSEIDAINKIFRLDLPTT